MNFFTDFTLETLPLATGPLRVRHGGSGRPLILLHGNPQTHAMWHKIAPVLAQKFHVICPDIRGYGGSHKPPVSEGSLPYAKKEMAKDIIALMDHFGIDKAQIGSHDRGSRVAHRLAIDFPQRVERLAVMDIIPTLDHFERADMAFALKYYHWFWFAQAHPFPENLINRAPEDWFWAHTSREAKQKNFFHPDALADYLAAAHDPEMISGMCEDYRAAATIDLVHDRESRERGDKINCNLLVLWGSEGIIGKFYDPLAVWRGYCNGTVRGQELPSGHYLAEEDPEGVLAAFGDFFRS